MKPKSFPNALIGITINNGLIKEIIIKNDSLKKKGIFLKEGIYKDKNGNSFDLRSWKLYKGQRAYIPINSFSTFIDFVNHFSCDSSFVIMDEFRASVFDWETEHLCMPKKLNTFKKKREIEIEKQYEEAGKNLLYYTVYFHTFLKFLNSLGFTSIKYDIEQKLAKELIQEKWISLKRYYFTNAFICSRREKRSLKTFKIEFPQQKLV